MKLKSFLILMTFIAVVSDYILHPFYPHFFEDRFGVTSSDHVGFYFSSLCLMVMVAFPFWAFISKKVSELNILIYTQLMAGCLALYCYYTDSYLMFWVVSLVMVFFKGSYLLIYPYTLKVVEEEQHTQTIGLLSVIVHLGGILGAILGGVVLDYITPESIFLVMALGDFIQMSMSFYLLRSKRYDTSLIKEEALATVKRSVREKSFILKIGLVTMLLYFSEFLIRPFFSKYWEMVSQTDSKLLTGLVYAIPGIVAIGILWYNSKSQSPEKPLSKNLLMALVIGIVGVFLQGVQHEAVIIIGRLVYGWAVFQGAVKFDALLFQSSTLENYATDYSKVHFMQSLGVLIASSTVGMLVSSYGFQISFTLALVGFLVTLIAFLAFFSHLFKSSDKPVASTEMS